MSACMYEHYGVCPSVCVCLSVCLLPEVGQEDHARCVGVHVGEAQRERTADAAGDRRQH